MYQRIPILISGLMFLLTFGSYGQRSLIQFDHSLTHREKSETLTPYGGKVMVSWPGHAWVRWEKEIDLPAEILSKLTRIDFEHFLDWEQVHPSEHSPVLACSTGELPDNLPVKSFQKGTSDTLKGHSVCFGFMVNQTGSAFEWTPAEQQGILSNGPVNLIWWSEQALLYEIEATFEFVPYLYNDPVCQVSTDPTNTTNRSWVSEIMSAMGYTIGNNVERETELAKDIISEYESDWAFLAYFIKGAQPYRSNAALFGPSTTVAANAGRNGFTFAHEVGHIYGLRDEYEERAPGVYDFELNDLLNLNADFRNYINAPCIMKSLAGPFGLCCYNPVHLHWTNEFHEFEIFTDPEDAIFQLQYLNPNTNQPLQTRLHQGRTKLPLGLGTKIRLSGLPEINVASGTYDNPVWHHSGTDRIDITIEDNTYQSTEILYQYAEPSAQFVVHLDMGEAYMGRRIQQLDVDGWTLLSLSSQGITTWDGQFMELFDIDMSDRPGPRDYLYRAGFSYHNIGDRHWVIGARQGNTLPEIVEIREEQEIQSYKPPENFRTIGGYVAVVKTDDDFIVGAFEEGDLHVFDPDHTFSIIGRNQGLPDPMVSALALHPNGKIWVGFDGGRTGQEFSGLYTLDILSGTFARPLEVPVEFRDLPVRKILIYDQGATILIITTDQYILYEFGEWQIHDQPKGSVFDAKRIEPGRWIFGGSLGVSYQDEQGEWLHLDVDNSQIIENVVRAVAYMPGGFILAGHAQHGISAIFTGELSVQTEEQVIDAEHIRYFPNPVTGGEFFLSSELDLGDSAIQLIDMQGRLLLHQDITLSKDGIVPVQLSISLPAGIYAIRLEGHATGYIGLLQVVR